MSRLNHPAGTRRPQAPLRLNEDWERFVRGRSRPVPVRGRDWLRVAYVLVMWLALSVATFNVGRAVLKVVLG